MTDALKQERSINLFEQISTCSQPHALGQIVSVLTHRQHQNGHLRSNRQNLRKRLSPIHRGHVKIQKHNIGVDLLNQLDAFKTIGSFAHDFKIALSRQQRL